MCRNQLWKCAALSLALAVAAGCSGYNSTGPNYPPAAKADLIVTDSVNTATPAAGAEFFFIFHVRNHGPDAATSVTLTDALPVGMGFNSGTVNGLLAGCSLSNGIVTCDVGTLASGADARIIVSVNAPVTAGNFSSVVTVGSAVSDPIASNNSVTIPVQVAAGVASFAPAGPVGTAVLAGSAQPTPVIYASVVQVLTHKDRP